MEEKLIEKVVCEVVANPEDKDGTGIAVYGKAMSGGEVVEKRQFKQDVGREVARWTHSLKPYEKRRPEWIVDRSTLSGMQCGWADLVIADEKEVSRKLDETESRNQKNALGGVTAADKLTLAGEGVEFSGAPDEIVRARMEVLTRIKNAIEQVKADVDLLKVLFAVTPEGKYGEYGAGDYLVRLLQEKAEGVSSVCKTIGWRVHDEADKLAEGGAA